ncbi:MAG: ABC transporter permease [Nitrososphaeraceae archaeon]
MNNFDRYNIKGLNLKRITTFKLTRNRLNFINSKFLTEFKNNTSGIIGSIILFFLILLTIYAFVAIPSDSIKEWNNPSFWINNPKGAAPMWSNLIYGNKVPEHIILSYDKDSLNISETDIDNFNNYVTSNTEYLNNMKVINHDYHVNYNFDEPPTDIMFSYSLEIGEIPSAIEIKVSRPDGTKFILYFDSISSSLTETNNLLKIGRIFSTDSQFSNQLKKQESQFQYPADFSNPVTLVFSNLNNTTILKGEYIFTIKFYLFKESDSVKNSAFILGGKTFGLLGTDEMRRDLIIGLIGGTPWALFIGLSVSIVSIFIGLLYGVIAGYKGKRLDEGMMRINDIFYSLPTLPILIILTVFIGRSIFLIILFIIFFGWMGTAKISRSLALQIKTFQYVESAKLIGQSDTKIIIKHIIPQLLPLTFASIALSVPGAILVEAGLSFIGLGDPSILTWGQMLHEANSAAAASRGLWWWLIPPGVMIALTGLAFVLIGNALESIFHPKMLKK